MEQVSTRILQIVHRKACRKNPCMEQDCHIELADCGNHWVLMNGAKSEIRVEVERGSEAGGEGRATI